MKFLVFVVVAAAAVAAGVYLSKFAPVSEDPTYVVRPIRRRTTTTMVNGKPTMVETQLDSLKHSLDALKTRNREMQDLLPPEDRDPASMDKNEAADALFKKDKSLGDYKNILMEAVKSMSNFGKDITEPEK